MLPKCSENELRNKVKHRGAPTFLNHSGSKSLYFPSRRGKPYILSPELKFTNRITIAIFEN